MILVWKLEIIYNYWDKIYIKVKGQWTYMYGIVDPKGNTIDFYLREKGQIWQGEKSVKKTSQVNQSTLRFYCIVIDFVRDRLLF